MAQLRRTQLVFWITAVFLSAAVAIFYPTNKVAAERETADTQDIGYWIVDTPPVPNTKYLISSLQPITPTLSPPDQACVMCHSDTTAHITFAAGETVSAAVDLTALANSAHGQAEEPLACTACHAPANYQFPHPSVETSTLREYQLTQSATCEQCHQQPHLTSHPGPETDNPVACTDCHGSHEVASVEAWEAGEETAVCVNCHEQQQVPLSDAAQLNAIIQSGLFVAQVSSDYCLACHNQPDLNLEFANGDIVSATIDPTKFHDSVHGQNNEWEELQCTDCHKNYRFPHEPVVVTTARDYTLSQAALCIECHQENHLETQDSVHTTALTDGNKESAVCTDCHGAHDTPVPNEPRSRISQTCRQCHSTIFDDYATSVHGEALLDEDNQDVPTCVECHGVHSIQDPTTADFRINSPNLCASCHADKELMAKYEVSTDVFDTYVADFHGTTVTLFAEEHHVDAETNKAVCYDCHGIHNIKKPDDPESGIKENLLATCQQCHPDANDNFPDAWTSHFRPSLQHNPLVYLVNLFYQMIIPATVGGLGFLVLTDIYRRVRLAVRR